MKKILLTLAALPLALSFSHRAFADTVLYDNGPVNGNVDGFDISQADGDAAANSFTITTPADATGVVFDTWNFPGDTLSATDWSISTTALPGTIYGNDPGDTGTTLDSGTGDPVTSVFLFSNDFGYDIDQNTITLPTVSLDPGTYYLTLQNAVVSGGDPTYWDESDGPSTAYATGIGNLNGFNGPGFTGSETFQILGTETTPAPEPSGLVSIGIGVALLGLYIFRRRTVI